MTYLDVGLKEHEYRAILNILGREPNIQELRILGVMWSEHCSYKSTRPLLSMFPNSGGAVVQGPGENAGIVDIGGGWGAAFKVESHNHPSAVSPFQGAATGVGGIIRDILAMGARPVASLDGLCLGDRSLQQSRSLED
ncbi:MAG TPA: phosphoribosylformylglycinamidine synthase subunit PurL, partial [Synergistetes bacterium]|nr:phosphoribosylformylglycinamidine synthase subunit PurL [Synergistota bacterium]